LSAMDLSDQLQNHKNWNENMKSFLDSRKTSGRHNPMNVTETSYQKTRRLTLQSERRRISTTERISRADQNCIANTTTTIRG
jgi:hypothetical protein